MIGYRVLQDGLTFAKRIRHAGDVVLEVDVPYGLLDMIQEQAPEVGDVFNEVLEVIELDEAALESLLLEAEMEEVEVEGLHLHRDANTGREWWVGKDGRPICAHPLGEGKICGQITAPGKGCRHHPK